MSERYTSLELHSQFINVTNMADRWLNRLALVDIIPPNIRNERREYNFDYNNYDEEQFRGRYRLTKASSRYLLEIIGPSILPHNENFY